MDNKAQYFFIHILTYESEFFLSWGGEQFILKVINTGTLNLTIKLKQMNKLIAISKASTIPVEGIQENTFADMGLFLLISLILGVILFFSRHCIIDIISKIGSMFRNMIEKYLFKIPHFERYYNQGFFLLHWTLVWLVCRLTVIKPIYETLMVDSESLVL